MRRASSPAALLLIASLERALTARSCFEKATRGEPAIQSMSYDYQVDIPPSFFAVYTNARGRLSEPLSEVRARYDVCEDLANILVQQALLLHHAELPSESGILLRIHAGLAAAESGVTPAEAAWIVERLAELLNWRCPELESNSAAGDAAGVPPSDG